MSNVIAVEPSPPRSQIYRATRIAISLLPLLIVHLSLIAIPYLTFTLTSFILVVVVTRIAGFGITVGYHRYFSHHGFKTSRGFQFLLGLAGATALQKGPLWWVAHHRLHHKHSDTADDPHSPVMKGFVHGHMGWLFTQDLMNPDYHPVRDLTRYPELQWLDRFWMIPGLLLAGLCYAIDGWSGLVYGYCLGVVLVFQVTFAVNSIGHLFGPQRYDTGDGSRNNWILGIIGLGDGWHNNHHRAPTSARHGFAWYEFDQSYSLIKLLKRLGIVWGVRLPPVAVMEAAKAPKEPNPPAESVSSI